MKDDETTHVRSFEHHQFPQEMDPSLQKHARRKRGAPRPPRQWRTCQGLIRPVMNRESQPGPRPKKLTAVLCLSLASISQKAPPVTTSTSYMPSCMHADPHGPDRDSGTCLYCYGSLSISTYCCELRRESCSSRIVALVLFSPQTRHTRNWVSIDIAAPCWKTRGTRSTMKRPMPEPATNRLLARSVRDQIIKHIKSTQTGADEMNMPLTTQTSCEAGQGQAWGVLGI